MDKLVVLGAGWLGKALCQEAINKKWAVEGTRTTKTPDSTYLKELRLHGAELQHTLTLDDAWWVCAIPPKTRQANSQYLELLDKCLCLFESMSGKGMILCSSTGVYDQHPKTYTECSEIKPSSKRQNTLITAENRVLEKDGKVLRLAGLVGPNREPGNFIAGKLLPSSANGRVNMVHQNDVINGVFTLIKHWQKADDIYNLSNPWHPTRQMYYQQKCQELGTAPPSFTHNDKLDRIIDGHAICTLGFEYLNNI